MMKNYLKLWMLLVGTWLILVAPIFPAWGESILMVRDYHHQTPIIAIPMNGVDRFTIRYIHSVDHSPVFEVFSIDPKNGLILEETYFRMFGAGMGHWQGHGQIIQDGEWIKIIDIHKPLGSFLLRIGAKTVAHTILIGESAINLSELAAGTLAEISVVSH